MDLQPDVNKLNRKLLQIIGKEMIKNGFEYAPTVN